LERWGKLVTVSRENSTEGRAATEDWKKRFKIGEGGHNFLDSKEWKGTVEKSDRV